MSRAYQLATDLLSPVMITPSGSRGESSWKMRFGLTGSAGSIARSLSVSHHSATFFSMPGVR